MPEINELKQAVRTFRGSLWTAGIMSFFINLCFMALPVYMIQLHQRAVPAQSEHTLFALTAIALFIFAVMGGLQILRGRMLVRVGNRLERAMDDRLFHAMFQKDLLQPGSGSSQPIGDLTQLRQFLSGQGLTAIFDAPWALILVTLLFILSPWIGLLALVATLTFIVLAVLNAYLTRDALRAANREANYSRDFLNHNLRNAPVVHALGMEPQIRHRWLRHHIAFLRQQTSANDYGKLISDITGPLRYIFIILGMGLTAYLIIAEGMFGAGMIFVTMIILRRALGPIMHVINAWPSFINTRMAYDRLQSLLSEIPAQTRRMSLPPPRGYIDVTNAVVIPPKAKLPILRGVNFSIAAGEAVGIIGPSAAGKTSLAHALLGIWPVRGGDIRLDGADITHYNRDELGPYLGYLPQDIELFGGSVSENIARYGKVDSRKVVTAAKLAGVHEMILHLPQGYDTPLGSGGLNLSPGQRQRIGLARAVYDDPVLVVLDEPNANLDDQGEIALQTAVTSLIERGTTLFLISHRPGILRQMHKLIVLQDGQMALFGPTEKVLAKLANNKEHNVLSLDQARLSLQT